MKVFDSQNLKKIGDLQQQLATGYNDGAEFFKVKELSKLLLEACADSEIRCAVCVIAVVDCCVLQPC